MPVTPEMIVSAFRALGGHATAPQIRDKLLELYPDEPMGQTPLRSVQARLQENSSDSNQHKKRLDLFFRVTPVERRQGVWGLREDVQSPASGDDEQQIKSGDFADEAEIGMAEEGRKRLRMHLHRERNKNLIQVFKKNLSSCTCRVCGFDFRKVYGKLGENHIEAHHTLPIAAGLRRTRLEDLVEVCSNCHRMLHRSNSMAGGSCARLSSRYTPIDGDL